MSQPDDATKDAIVRQLPADLRSVEAVQALLSDPLTTITAMITGALASGRADVTLAAGHIVQATLKGRAFEQLGQELNGLLKKGKIRPDYAETKYGFPSLVELMKAIDSDATDQDKLRAAKAMFVAVNSPDAPKSEDSLRYQFFKIVLTLNGPQLAMLAASFSLLKKGTLGGMTSTQASIWLQMIGKILGHNVVSLMEQDETMLIKSGIMFDRVYPDRSGVVQLQTARLTDLGVKMAELIEQYDSAIPVESAK